MFRKFKVCQKTDVVVNNEKLNQPAGGRVIGPYRIFCKGDITKERDDTVMQVKLESASDLLPISFGGGLGG